MIQEGTVKNHSELAHLGRVSAARITQVMTSTKKTTRPIGYASADEIATAQIALLKRLMIGNDGL
jgi:hypothetical protein